MGVWDSIKKYTEELEQKQLAETAKKNLRKKEMDEQGYTLLS